MLLQGLRNGLYDLVVAMTPDGPAEGAFMTWKEPLTWVGDSPTSVVTDGNANLRIVCYPEGCLYRRAMLTALQRSGRGYDLVYTSPSLAGLEAAVGSGFGNTVLAGASCRPSSQRSTRRWGCRASPMSSSVSISSSDRKRSAVAESFAAHFADAFLASSRDD